MTLEDPGQHRKPAKRPRRDPEPEKALTPEAPAGRIVRQGEEGEDLPAMGPSEPTLGQDTAQGEPPDSQPGTPQDRQDSRPSAMATLDPAQVPESPEKTTGGDEGGQGPNDDKEEMITDLHGPRTEDPRAATVRTQDPGSNTSTPAAPTITTLSTATGPGVLSKEEDGDGPGSADPAPTVLGPRSKARRSTVSYGSTDARERGMDPRTGAWGPAATVDQLTIGGRMPGTRRLSADTVTSQRLGLAAWIARGKLSARTGEVRRPPGQENRRFCPGEVEGGREDKSKEQATESDSGGLLGAKADGTTKGPSKPRTPRGVQRTHPS